MSAVHGMPAHALGQPPLAGACARYAELVIRQLEAAHAEDFDAFDQIAAERDALAAEIAALRGDETAADGLAEAHLTRAAEADRLLLERLAMLRTVAATELQHLDQRRAGALAYAVGTGTSGGAVDLRL